MHNTSELHLKPFADERAAPAVVSVRVWTGGGGEALGSEFFFLISRERGGVERRGKPFAEPIRTLSWERIWNLKNHNSN